MDERAHYILILALVEDKSFIVNKYFHYVYYVCGYYEGNYYIAKPPGLSFLGIPIYLALKYLGNYILFFKEYEFMLIAFVTFISALTTVLVFDTCRLFECNERTAVITSLLYAFGTIAWTNAKMLEDGSVSPFFILLGIYLIIKTSKSQNPTRLTEYGSFFLAGLSLGYSLLVEYTNVVAVVPIVISSMILYPRVSLRKISFYVFFLPLLTCGAIILWLNYIIFGSPFETVYTYHVVTSTMEYSIANIPSSGFEILFYSTEGGSSLFIYEPLIFLTSSYGIILMYRKYKKDAVLFIITAVLHTLFFSLRSHHGNVTHHIGPAYMPAILPLLVIPTIFTIEYFSSQNVSQNKRWLFWGIFVGLFAFSVAVIGMCVLAYNVDILNTPIAYIPAFKLLRSGYLDPRLLKHRFIPVIAGIILFVIVFERYFKKIYNFIVKSVA